jgi:hypothetical protein
VQLRIPNDKNQQFHCVHAFSEHILLQQLLCACPDVGLRVLQTTGGCGAQSPYQQGGTYTELKAGRGECRAAQLTQPGAMEGFPEEGG